MDDQIDHGPIIEQFEEEINQTDTFETLAERLFNKSADKIADIINNYQASQTTKPQDDSKATYTKIISRGDGYIDLSSTGSLKIENLKLKIRAFHPWPGVYTKYQISNIKYQIIKLLPNQKLQVEGKKPMSYKDFINGYEKGKFFLEKLSLI